MSHVFVIDQDKKPLNPVHPAHARLSFDTLYTSVYRAARRGGHQRGGSSSQALKEEQVDREYEGC